ncbi:MAG TPA: tetratricopeptide repeat protein [Dissulfurispiraceae bacterium]|nr:tetratricopeptide repeat protein [Dissulfurispiraceae bacterium]
MSKKNKAKKPKAPPASGQLSTGSQANSGIYNKTVLHIVLIAVLGILAYSNTFSVPFMFDDKAPNGQIEDNLMIRDLGNFCLALKGHDFGGTEGYIFVPRRFVGYLSFALDYKIHGLNLAGYHIVNLVIHIATALLVYFLVLLTFRTPFFHDSRFTTHDSRPLIAFFSAALFVSHPIQTEAVTYIVQRFTSLAAMFYLLSLVFYIKARLLTSSKKPFAFHLMPFAFFILSFLSAFLAMMTKEIAFTLPVIVLLYELMFFRHTFKRSLLLSVITGAIVISASVVVLGVSGGSLGNMLSDLGQKTRLETNIPRWDYLMTQMRVVTTYVRLLFWPANQNLDYDYPVSHSLLSLPVFLSFAFLFLLFGLGIYLVMGKRQRAIGNRIKAKSKEGGDSNFTPQNAERRTLYAERLMGFGILWFFITLSVESSVIPIADVIYEHRMYLPSVGAFIALTVFIFTIVARSNPRFFSYASAGLLCIVVIFCVATYKRNMVWQNEMTMWEDIVSKSPQKARALNNVAAIDIDRHQPEAALEYLKRSLAADPNYMDAYRNLANAYLDLGVYDKALAVYKKLLEAEPKNTDALANIATVYIKTGNYDAARDTALQALAINPRFPDAYVNLSAAYRKLGRYDDALKAVNQALMIRPDFAPAHNNLGLIYVELKRFDDAAASFRRSIELDPSFAEAYNNLGGVFFVQKHYDSAIETLKKALALDPKYVSAYVNLGAVYALKGDRSSAMEQYAVLEKISPPNAERLLGIIGK